MIAEIEEFSRHLQIENSNHAQNEPVPTFEEICETIETDLNTKLNKPLIIRSTWINWFIKFVEHQQKGYDPHLDNAVRYVSQHDPEDLLPIMIDQAQFLVQNNLKKNLDNEEQLQEIKQKPPKIFTIFCKLSTNLSLEQNMPHFKELKREIDKNTKNTDKDLFYFMKDIEVWWYWLQNEYPQCDALKESVTLLIKYNKRDFKNLSSSIFNLVCTIIEIAFEIKQNEIDTIQEKHPTIYELFLELKNKQYFTPRITLFRRFIEIIHNNLLDQLDRKYQSEVYDEKSRDAINNDWLLSCEWLQSILEDPRKMLAQQAVMYLATKFNTRYPSDKLKVILSLTKLLLHSILDKKVDNARDCKYLQLNHEEIMNAYKEYANNSVLTDKMWENFNILINNLKIWRDLEEITGWLLLSEDTTSTKERLMYCKYYSRLFTSKLIIIDRQYFKEITDAHVDNKDFISDTQESTQIQSFTKSLLQSKETINSIEKHHNQLSNEFSACYSPLIAPMYYSRLLAENETHTRIASVIERYFDLFISKERLNSTKDSEETETIKTTAGENLQGDLDTFKVSFRLFLSNKYPTSNQQTHRWVNQLKSLLQKIHENEYRSPAIFNPDIRTSLFDLIIRSTSLSHVTSNENLKQPSHDCNKKAFSPLTSGLMYYYSEKQRMSLKSFTLMYRNTKNRFEKSQEELMTFYKKYVLKVDWHTKYENFSFSSTPLFHNWFASPKGENLYDYRKMIEAYNTLCNKVITIIDSIPTQHTTSKTNFRHLMFWNIGKVKSEKLYIDTNFSVFKSFTNTIGNFLSRAKDNAVEIELALPCYFKYHVYSIFITSLNIILSYAKMWDENSFVKSFSQNVNTPSILTTLVNSLRTKLMTDDEHKKKSNDAEDLYNRGLVDIKAGLKGAPEQSYNQLSMWRQPAFDTQNTEVYTSSKKKNDQALPNEYKIPYLHEQDPCKFQSETLYQNHEELLDSRKKINTQVQRRRDFVLQSLPSSFQEKLKNSSHSSPFQLLEMSSSRTFGQNSGGQ